MHGARRIAPLLLACSSALAVLVVACSNGSSGSGGQTCPGGFDASGLAGGAESVSEEGQCGNSVTGNKQTGAACQQSAECAASGPVDGPGLQLHAPRPSRS